MIPPSCEQCIEPEKPSGGMIDRVSAGEIQNSVLRTRRLARSVRSSRRNSSASRVAGNAAEGGGGDPDCETPRQSPYDSLFPLRRDHIEFPEKSLESNSRAIQNFREIISPPAGKDRLLDDKQAAAILGVTPGTLAVWRSTGRYSLPFIKIGRSVRYRLSHLNEWVEGRTRNGGATA